jgi:hypothetical protein
MIPRRSIRTIEPSYIHETQFAPDGSRLHRVKAMGYAVTYRDGRTTRRASTTANDLQAVGLPVPAMPRGADYAPSRRP